MQWWYDLY